MLTDLSFIQDGQPWPPKDQDEANRLAEHAFMRQVYNGLHEKIFPRYIAYLADAPRDQKKQAIILDWPELATGTYLNMLLGEEVEIAAPVEDDHLPDRPDEQVFIDVSRYGIGLYEISDNGIQALNPENCYLVVTPGNIQTPWAFVFFHLFKSLDSEKKEREYVKFTIHTKGQIQHVVYEISEMVVKVQGAELIQGSGKALSGPKKLQDFPAFASLSGMVDKSGIQKPAVDDILIVHVQNQLSSERYYGRSDYKPSVLSLVESLGMLFTQRAEVVAKFTNPTPVIPESATTFDHKTQEWVYRPGQPIIMQPGDASPSLMVWDAQLSQVDRAIEQEMDQLLQMLQLSRVLLAGKDAGTAESGTALRIRLIPTLAKVSKYARAAETAIPKVLHLWSQLPANGPVMEEKDIQVLLQDGIPEDPMETVQEAEILPGSRALRRKPLNPCRRSLT
jgi:hypothetical protein